jgi:hypothetical protein
LRSFADAMLRKLVREVANAGSSGQMQ